MHVPTAYGSTRNDILYIVIERHGPSYPPQYLTAAPVVVSALDPIGLDVESYIANAGRSTLRQAWSLSGGLWLRWIVPMERILPAHHPGG